MYEQNKHVLNSIKEWLARDEKVFLVTVVTTWGASPRPPGSLFAYNSSLGMQVGSLSGGCIEDALVEHLSLGNTQYPFIKVFGDHPDDAQRYMLPCGGTMSLLIEALDNTHLSYISKIISTLDSRKWLKREVCLDTGQADIRVMNHKEAHDIDKVSLDNARFTHVLGPIYQVLIVGVGEVARNLLNILKAIDFHVELCDARSHVVDRHDAKSWDTPLHLCLPDDLIKERFSDSYSAVLALAHDPRVDDLAVMAGLHSRCFLVGAMGSQNTTSKRLQRLRTLGFASEELARLNAPIGFPIGSKLPAEIAVSIAAQLIQERNKVSAKMIDSRRLCSG